MVLRITCKLTVIISMFLCTSHTIYAQDVDLLLGTISPGTSITIKYKVDVNISFSGTSVSNQEQYPERILLLCSQMILMLAVLQIQQ